MNNLLHKIKEVSHLAASSKTLQKILTTVEYISQNSRTFTVLSLQKGQKMLKPSNMEIAASEKQMKEEQKQKVEEIKETNDCFRPYDKTLYIDTISVAFDNSFKKFVVELNKFMVVDNHVLIFPEEFAPQTNHMTPTDFCAILRIRKDLVDETTTEDNWLTFYNRGIFSGCSQPHQHFQLVPIRRLDTKNPNFSVPEVLDDLAQQQYSGDAAFEQTLQEIFPFKVGFRELISVTNKDIDVESRAAELWKVSNDLLGRLGMLQDSPEKTGKGLIVRCNPEEKYFVDLESTKETSYNLLFTNKWILIVPRKLENYEGISLNALGFMFSFFAKNDQHRELMVADGGMGCLNLLKHVTFPLK